MVSITRKEVQYIIMLNSDINIESVQNDLGIKFRYSDYSKTIVAVSFYSDKFNQVNNTKFNNMYVHALSALNDVDYIKIHGFTYKIYDEDTDKYIKYTKQEIEDLFDEYLKKYNSTIQFEFTESQKKIVDLILSHNSIKHNVKYTFWKEEIVPK